MSISYKDSGVDKEEGYRSVEKIKERVKATYNKNVMNELGSFGALYKLGEYKKPILVSGTDGDLLQSDGGDGSGRRHLLLC